jgi:hypothetical protein
MKDSFVLSCRMHSMIELVNAPNTACTRSPAAYAGVMMVGVAAFSGSLRDSKLVPAKWRCLVPPTSG